MAECPLARRLLIVEARDLDTDARDRTEVTVDVPREAAAQREQLAEIVRQLHPSAKLRSFADGAATFLGPGHLVVAHYGEHLPVESGPARVSNQQSLFAA